ncbi:glyoxylase I family protein [Gracilibacillus orientalis]|uniref:Glyoxylase I family protein n=1 Tax=Gracilibacillus orientalis TaxID=334253 RepID=A0A1I4HQJ9_9BACI|nr:VOC family protein [Gracilibacillus orientalis]SFL44030.1 glyoxylase I family protein [Gracilibacillus orientalis]
MFAGVHHIAVICSDYQVSKEFYVNKLGLSIIKEVYREERNSYKLDLALHDKYVIELFSFPNPPERPSFPEACGLRHLAFSVEDVEQTATILEDKGIMVEKIRVDSMTNKRFTFFQDPDQLPIELYEV